ncbi:MAG TPA: HAD-IA family hydrolase [Candidatus Saccharimonadales bacterium]|nr:HAD-IA family hydrolase [Candidatus Saccharimonadales bacterium]
MIKAVIFDCFGVIYVDGAIDESLLDYIKKLRPKFKTAMLSNIDRDFLAKIFNKSHPKDEYFDFAAASSEIGYTKPDPEAYQIVCQKLGVEPSECVFIDDMKSLADGARAVGMQVIVYHDFEQMKNELEPLMG